MKSLFPSTVSKAVTSSILPQTYALLALAFLFTALGVFVGAVFALPIIASGWVMVLLLLELGIIWTAPRWSQSSPLNLFLFIVFPFFSGLTATPFLMHVLGSYVNGASILLNASIATMLLCIASAIMAMNAERNLSLSYGGILIRALLGLIVFAIAQLFFPALRTGVPELIVTGIGIIVFVIFLAVDMQRLLQSGRSESPFLLALSLYLDIFNLFMHVVRFMLAWGGGRR